MSAKFTPGPWGRNISPASRYPTIYAGRNTHVAVLARVPDEQMEANAFLIAAAPALYEALERIAGFTLSQFMGPHDMALECVNVARTALSLSRGEQS